jgi:hypothetical protein
MPNDAGAPIMACSGNLVKLRRWCLSRSERGSPKAKSSFPVGKSLLIRGSWNPGPYQADGDFLLKVWEIFQRASGCLGSCRRFTGP